MNLVGNAMKFTFKGYVRIFAEVVQVNEINAIKIGIEDTGYGIKKENQNQLFQLFSTIEATKQINQSGTGIGLY